MDPPRGKGHCAFFGVNIVTSSTAVELEIQAEGRRGYIVAEDCTQREFRRRVMRDVTEALESLPRDQALKKLDQIYIWEGQDFRAEFAVDVQPSDVLKTMIEDSFAGVTRGGGITLHEAIAIDDYASPEEQAIARAKDTDIDWHDAPSDVITSNCSFFSYLDPISYRYYLPAAMMLCLNDTGETMNQLHHRTYWSLLPVIAPRDFGKGHGNAFDVEQFISQCQFSEAHVSAIYCFLCWAAVEDNQGVDEEQLPAMRKWRESAQRRMG